MKRLRYEKYHPIYLNPEHFDMISVGCDIEQGTEISHL
jgi:hypothetical protein